MRSLSVLISFLQPVQQPSFKAACPSGAAGWWLARHWGPWQRQILSFERENAACLGMLQCVSWARSHLSAMLHPWSFHCSLEQTACKEREPVPTVAWAAAMADAGTRPWNLIPFLKPAQHLDIY